MANSMFDYHHLHIDNPSVLCKRHPSRQCAFHDKREKLMLLTLTVDCLLLKKTNLSIVDYETLEVVKTDILRLLCRTCFRTGLAGKLEEDLNNVVGYSMNDCW